MYYTPPAFLTLVLFSLTIASDEGMPVNAVLKLQRENPLLLYGIGYSIDQLNYKYFGAREHLPRILALGTSRVLNFRQEFFNEDPSAFYNAGAAGWRIGRIYSLLTSLDGVIKPEIVILEIDQAWFHPEASTAWGIKFNTNPLDPARLVQRSDALLRELVTGETSLPRVLSPTSPYTGQPVLGLGAIHTGGGYRYDGSRQSEPRLFSPEARREAIQSDFDRLISGGVNYMPGDQVSARHLQNWK